MWRNLCGSSKQCSLNFSFSSLQIPHLEQSGKISHDSIIFAVLEVILRQKVVLERGVVETRAKSVAS